MSSAVENLRIKVLVNSLGEISEILICSCPFLYR